MARRSSTPAAGRKRTPTPDPLWYQDAIIYELHVRAFADSTGDGMGDFRGLTQKLDYLHDLGITAIWLLPFYPSPWKDDGYDISDYTGIHPTYGEMRDFRRFLREAHRRDIRVITELVINHTSDQHHWFQRARRARPGTSAHDFYVWSDTPEKYGEARIIFKDFESSNWAWDPVAHAYYWHRFYSHQPDLNFDHPAVHEAIFRVMDYWFRLGVDGMRLDAIPYLFERDGTNCENLPETHLFLKKLRAHLDTHYTARMLLAEANQWPEETVPYFGDGDECHMGFNFPVMPRLFMAIQMEDRFPILDILRQTPAIPAGCQWATFLRNHDELTLEMVTDEERDYMYRVYANDPQARINLGIRRRLAPLLGNNRRKIELMNALLLSLPGTPVLYYGDELGMGDNIYLGDRNGVRTPMQWSADRNAGFSTCNPQRLYLPVIVDPEYHYETVNVEAQQANPSSLLWWTKRVISLRKRFRAFSRGAIEFIHPENRKVLAFIRSYDGERVLVVANLSRFVQFVHLDLTAYAGAVPVELFGRTRFPTIGAHPYFLSLGPHNFYWFELRAEEQGDRRVRAPGSRPVLRAATAGELFATDRHPELADAINSYLIGQRWFQGKARPVRGITIEDTIPLELQEGTGYLVLARVSYVEEEAETYLLPVAPLSGIEQERVAHDSPGALIVPVEIGGEAGALVDGLAHPAFRAALFSLVLRRGRCRGGVGDVRGIGPARLRRSWADATESPSRLLGAEQSNTSVVLDSRVVLKVYRRLEQGMSLDLEIGRFLTDRGFAHSPAVLGALEYRPHQDVTRTLGVVQEFVPNEGDAWALTLDAVREYLERAAASPQSPPPFNAAAPALLTLASSAPADPSRRLIGPYIEEARLLGQRTAELHLVLASENEDPSFAPESFTSFYQRSLYQSMRTSARRALQALAGGIDRLPSDLRPAATAVLQLEEVLLARLRGLVEQRINGARIRTHGDYHLGQVLFTGRDFYITDFEGEPIRPLSERRLKRSPLRDVAGMLRSFHYAASKSLADHLHDLASPGVDTAELERCAEYWYVTVSGAFLHDYLRTLAPAQLLPSDPDMLAVLLQAYLIEKAVYELGYELNNRPAWAGVPLQGLLQLVQTDQE